MGSSAGILNNITASNTGALINFDSSIMETGATLNYATVFLIRLQI